MMCRIKLHVNKIINYNKFLENIQQSVSNLRKKKIYFNHYELTPLAFYF